MNNKAFKDYKSQIIHMIVEDTAWDYTCVSKFF